MRFGFNISFEAFAGSNLPSPASDKGQRREEKETAPNKSEEETRQRSGATRDVPEGRRPRVLADVADTESLRALEAETRANSELARNLDRKSLATLEQATRGRQPASPSSIDTPPSMWAYPIIHRLNDGSSSHRRHFSSEPLSRSVSPDSRKRVNERLHSAPVAGHAARRTEKQALGTELRTKLASEGWSRSSIDAIDDAERSGSTEGDEDSVDIGSDVMESILGRSSISEDEDQPAETRDSSSHKKREGRVGSDSEGSSRLQFVRKL